MSAELSQDKLVLEYFGGKTAGFFVEVGANHPTGGSQTWLLEQNGWHGILIEPQAGHCRLLREQRKNSRVFQVACSAPEKTGETTLHIPCDALNGFAAIERNVDDLGIVYERTEQVKVTTLDSIMAEAGGTGIDLLSIDVEGMELDVLKGLDLVKYRPALILLEDKCNSLQKHRYLAGHGYKLVRRTELNNWYIPRQTSFRVPLSDRIELFRKMYLGLPFRKIRRFRKMRALQKS
jgi:FkbM family methyltransferase